MQIEETTSRHHHRVNTQTYCTRKQWPPFQWFYQLEWPPADPIAIQSRFWGLLAGKTHRNIKAHRSPNELKVIVEYVENAVN